MSILDGTRVLEFAGIGPAPICGMMLADMGADVILIEPPTTPKRQPTHFIHRGKRSIALDLKSEEDARIAHQLIAWADVLIEGFRPGVMERLGFGPQIAHSANPGLVYTRVTGWGQDGPWAQMAGHDGNYTALAGALWYGGRAGETPSLPSTLVGDLAGGTMFALSGTLAALNKAQRTGEGQVVDAAIIDGVSNLLSLILTVGGTHFVRGETELDRPSPWSGVYPCKDGKHLKLGAREDKFYRQLCAILGLDGEFEKLDRYDKANWPGMRQRFSDVIASKTRDEWAAVFNQTDACATPVLSPQEAAQHPHMSARKIYEDKHTHIEPQPAPRFSETPSRPSGPIPEVDGDRAEILRELGE